MSSTRRSEMPIDVGFAEGFGTVDLQEAKTGLALLDLEQGDTVAER